MSKKVYFFPLFILLMIVLLSTDIKKLNKISNSLENFADVYKLIDEHYVETPDVNQLMRVAIDTMLSKIDPYTNYFSEAQIAQVQLGVRGGWDGVGIELLDMNGRYFVKEIVENSPAAQKNIKVGDELLAVDGSEIKDKGIEEIQASLKGKAGTKISIKINDYISGSELTHELERQAVEKENVPYYGMLDDITAYIVLTTFSQMASGNIKKGIEALQKTHQPEQLIIDLRDNGGGFLMEAVSICNLFVDQGKEIVKTRNKIADWDRSFTTTASPLDKKIPLIVLINGKSASASEIVAGALQDLDRAVLVGNHSFGKGLVQNTYDIGYNSKVKLTTAKYYIPSGRCVQALNYKDGKAIEVADSSRKAFFTKAGRTVYDGKGLEPDIQIQEEKEILIVKELIKNHRIFNFANQYRVDHDSIVEAREFQLNEAEYQAFINDNQSWWLNFETNSEKELKKLMEQSKLDQSYEASKPRFEKILETLRENKLKDFETHTKAIKKAIEQEIVSRYYYYTGKVEHRLASDTYILRSIELFSNKASYGRILKSPEK